MRALGYYLLIDEIKEDIKQTEGGLLLAETHRDDIRYRLANVISTGDLVKYTKPGDVVWFDKAAGSNIEYKNKVYTVLQEGNIIAIKDEDDG